MKNEEPSLLKIPTKDYEIKDLKYKTKKHDYKKILKYIKTDKKYYKKKYKSFYKKKTLLFITELLIGSTSTISSFTLAISNPSVGVTVSSSRALLKSIANWYRTNSLVNWKQDTLTLKIGLLLIHCYMKKLWKHWL